MSTNLVTINSINLISSWSYHLDKNSDCTICRETLNNDSIYAVENGSRSTISQGVCGHKFHSECITPWLNMNKKCPICSEKYSAH